MRPSRPDRSKGQAIEQVRGDRALSPMSVGFRPRGRRCFQALLQARPYPPLLADPHPGDHLAEQPQEALGPHLSRPPHPRARGSGVERHRVS